MNAMMVGSLCIYIYQRGGWTHFGLTLRTTSESFHRRTHALATVNANISVARVRGLNADSEWVVVNC